MLRKLLPLLLLVVSVNATIAADDSGDTALTIYNADFAVVRHGFWLDVKPGTNYVRFSGATAFL